MGWNVSVQNGIEREIDSVTHRWKWHEEIAKNEKATRLSLNSIVKKGFAKLRRLETRTGIKSQAVKKI